MLSANQGHRASVDRVREEVTLYEAVGGEPYFSALVERFYGEVAADDLLRPMYPRDLSGAEERLRLFLMQYWGGPTTYSDERGHPRLRMRHNPYRVDLAARDAWLRCMITALEADPPAEPMRSGMSAMTYATPAMRATLRERDTGLTLSTVSAWLWW